MAVALSILLSGCTAATETGEPNPTPTTTSYEQYDAMFADWASRYIECAREFGADAQLLNGGSIDQPYAPGRPVEDGLDADCLQKVGKPPRVPELTDSFLRGLYELLVEQAACLKAHGYVVSNPPTREEWVENYGADSWNPLSDVYLAGGGIEAEGFCPQPDPRKAEELGATLGGD
ncbi:MAG: hypothetical protein KF742_03175 [Cryobacterium sp.]|nr:hypothetical protein [Cryobacterium sp.]MCO5293964.1 hypothetical protein [Homoserinimonas sp.]